MTGVDQPQGTKRHGMTLLAVERMREKQQNRCAICLGPLPWVPEIDHDHALAKTHPHPEKIGCKRCVRALLCKNCNVMLGHAKDDPERLEAGAKYVRAWRARVG
jgi:hypothetical protein